MHIELRPTDFTNQRIKVEKFEVVGLDEEHYTVKGKDMHIHCFSHCCSSLQILAPLSQVLCLGW